MNVDFKDKKMEKVFNTSRLLDKDYGENAKVIRRRMVVLRAADNLEQISHLKPERRHELTGNRKGEFAVDLQHPFRITFIPNHNPIPVRDDGGIDLERISSIIIISVEDYHK